MNPDEEAKIARLLAELSRPVKGKPAGLYVGKPAFQRLCDRFGVKSEQVSHQVVSLAELGVEEDEG